MSKQPGPEVSGKRAIGTGLVALDVVVNGGGIRGAGLYAGGTCANVMAILASFGWSTQLVSRLRQDERWDLVQRDLSQWGVGLSHAHLEPEYPVPVIVQVLDRESRGDTDEVGDGHRFLFRCPECGGWFDRFRPITVEAVGRLTDNMGSEASGEGGIFFADRASAGIIELASYCKSAGLAVVFEPPSVGRESHFARMLELADCVKYSAEAFVDIGTEWDVEIPVEIKTEGARGLSVRRTKKGDESWTHQEAIVVEDSEIVDSAGAGDWCTAGFLLSAGYPIGKWLRSARRKDILDALWSGQTFAAWNCRFAGARGGMYAEDWQDKLLGFLRGSGMLGRELSTDRELATAGRVGEDNWQVVCSCDP